MKVRNIRSFPSVLDLILAMQFSMCVLYTFSFSVSSSLLFLFAKFNSWDSGSEISKDASRVVTSVHQFDYPRLCSCTRVSKAFLSGSSAFLGLQYLITFKFSPYLVVVENVQYPGFPRRLENRENRENENGQGKVREKSGSKQN